MNKTKKTLNTKKNIATNKKAFFNYLILEKYEAGIVLKGYEAKSIRAGKTTLQESFGKIIKNEIWLINCHIPPYLEASYQNLSPTRDRKLLLHKTEIKKITDKITIKGFSLIPLNLYFKNQNVKIELGLGKPKKLFDKRESLKEKTLQKEIAVRIRGRG